MTTATQRSFALGEVSPSFQGDADLELFRRALAKSRNMIGLKDGGVMARPGWEFVAKHRAVGAGVSATNPGSRCFFFERSNSGVCVLEFGNYFMRVHKGGAPVTYGYHATTSVSASSGHVIVEQTAHGFATGDEVRFTGCSGDYSFMDGLSYLITKVDDDHYAIRDLRTEANVPLTSSATTGAGNAGKVVVVVTPWPSSALNMLRLRQKVDVIKTVCEGYAPQEILHYSDTEWVIQQPTMGSSMPAPGNMAITGGSEGAVIMVAVTAVSPKGDESLRSTAASSGSDASGGSPLTYRWDSVDDVSYYKVYKSTNGSAFGFIGISFTETYVDRGSVPDYTKLPPISYDPTEGDEIYVALLSDMGIETSDIKTISWHSSGLMLAVVKNAVAPNLTLYYRNDVTSNSWLALGNNVQDYTSYGGGITTYSYNKLGGGVDAAYKITCAKFSPDGTRLVICYGDDMPHAIGIFEVSNDFSLGGDFDFEKRWGRIASATNGPYYIRCMGGASSDRNTAVALGGQGYIIVSNSADPNDDYGIVGIGTADTVSSDNEALAFEHDSSYAYIVLKGPINSLLRVNLKDGTQKITVRSNSGDMTKWTNAFSCTAVVGYNGITQVYAAPTKGLVICPRVNAGVTTLKTYYTNGSTFEEFDAQITQQPLACARAVFSPTSKYFSIIYGSANNGFISYKISGSAAATRLLSPKEYLNSLTYKAADLMWDGTSKYLIFGEEGAPYLEAFKIDRQGNFTKIQNFVGSGVTLTNAVDSLEWSPVDYGFAIGDRATVLFASESGNTEVAEDGVGHNRVYPRAIALFQERTCLGNTDLNSIGVQSSAIGSDWNFNTRAILLPTDGFVFNPDGNKINELRHLDFLGRELIVFASGHEASLSGTNSGLFAPGQTECKQYSANGSSWTEPVILDDTLIYVQTGGSIIRDLRYQLQNSGYKGNDLTNFASHRFVNREAIRLTVSLNPNPVIVATESDGTLNFGTYVREDGIIGWHSHDTQGTIVDAVAVREEGKDYLYALIDRTINSVTERYLERMAMSVVISAASPWGGIHMDCAKRITLGAASKTVTGLGHLIGKQVVVIADGVLVSHPWDSSNYPALTVSATGTLTLTVAATNIEVGLPYLCDVQTLDVESNNPTLVFKSKIFSRLALKVSDTLCVYAGTSDPGDSTPLSGLDPVNPTLHRIGELSSGNRLSPYTGDVKGFVRPNWSTHGKCFLRKIHPVPWTLRAVHIPLLLEGEA